MRFGKTNLTDTKVVVLDGKNLIAFWVVTILNGISLAAGIFLFVAVLGLSQSFPESRGDMVDFIIELGNVDGTIAYWLLGDRNKLPTIIFIISLFGLPIYWFIRIYKSSSSLAKVSNSSLNYSFGVLLTSIAMLSSEHIFLNVLFSSFEVVITFVALWPLLDTPEINDS